MLLDKVKPLIERSAATLRSEFEGGATLLPFDGGLPEVWGHELGERKPALPCRMSFGIDYPEHGSLELSFARAPTREQFDLLERRVRDLFSDVNMGPSEKGEHHRLTLSVRVDFSVDPATGRVVTPELDRMRPLTEKSVAALFAEFGEEFSPSPFSDADPLLPDLRVGRHGEEGGPFRVGVRIYRTHVSFSAASTG